jgi:hypothetical protein
MNHRDLEDIPPAACAGIHFEFLTTVDEALKYALEPETPPRPSVRRPEIQPNA